MSPDVQQRVRASTFEVVMPKGTQDQVTYDRPPRLDLIPFSVRNDAYWPIGTAFAVGPNRFLTAGHVLTATIGSPSGKPALRDAAGHIYPIERVLGFSLDRDFAFVAVGNAPTVEALPTSATHDLNQPVLAVGNALGEGIVIRDGLLTSETPEEMEGRWKWLRFSAAASPGVSGGPLLDSAGAVIGVITAKSPSENLNYALPIAEALQADSSSATLEVRGSLPLAILPQDPPPLRLSDHFELPQPIEQFGTLFEQAIDRADAAALHDVLRKHEATLFPRGKSAKVLATPYINALPTLVFESEEAMWEAPAPEKPTQADLPDDGLVQTSNSSGVQYFRIRRSGSEANDAFYADPKAFSDLLLKGARISRAIGTETVRITSLGPPASESIHQDRFGRRWQIRAWWIADLESYLLVFCLPTPEGYVGFGERIAAGRLSREIALGKVIADFTLVTYLGSPAQWKAFLAQTDLRPAALAQIRLTWDQSRGLDFASERFDLSVPDSAMTVSERSVVQLVMGFADPGAGPALLTVDGILILRSSGDKSVLVVLREAHPAKDAGRPAQRRWDAMARHVGEFDGAAHRTGEDQDYLIGTTLSLPSADAGHATGLDPMAIYAVEVLETEGSLPRELEDRQRTILKGLKVKEH